MGNLKTPIDVVGLREKLSKLTSEKLREEFISMDIEAAWKGGMNKAALVEKGIAAYVEKNTEVVDTEEEEGAETIPEGEYEVDQDLLDEFPGLVEVGFNLGDILISEEGKPYSKKEERGEGLTVGEHNIDQELLDEYPKLIDEGYILGDTIVVTETFSYSKKVVKNTKVVDPIVVEKPLEVEGEYIPEIIDETKFSVEEIQENIDICFANCSQAIPSTKIFLLRKIDALTLALERKKK